MKRLRPNDDTGQQFQDVDTVLVHAEQMVNLYDAVTPENWQRERDKVLSGRKDTPSFTYTSSPAVENQVKSVQQKLRTLQERLRHAPFPDDQLDLLRDYYLDVIADALHRSNIVLNRGNKKVVRHASQHLWGVPTSETLQFAYDILDEEDPILADLVDARMGKTDAEELRQELEDLFQRFNLTGWRTAYTDKTTHVSPIEKCVRIRSDRAGMIDTCHERLLLHEFGVHVLRAVNGWNQPYNLFAVGLHGYETTEEGITTYLEYRTGLLSEPLLRRYALRVLAVQSVLDYNSFKETFALLSAYTDEADAFHIAMRAHRGGGLAKDHIYLQGFLNIRNHMEQANDLNDLEDLYMGKIPLEELDQLRNLRNTCHIEAAKHQPGDFLTMFSTSMASNTQRQEQKREQHT